MASKYQEQQRIKAIVLINSQNKVFYGTANEMAHLYA